MKNDIEELKKYKKMWEEVMDGFKNKIFFYSVICEDTPIRYAEEFMKDIEHKYFPKED